MKIARKVISLVLVLAMAAGMTGCGQKNFSHKTLVKAAKKLDLEESSDNEEFYENFGVKNHWKEAYISVKDEDAQDIYDVYVNRWKDLPGYDVPEATAIAIYNDDGLYMVSLLTFESETRAKKFYKKYVDAYVAEGDDGEENGYTYTIYSYDSGNGKFRMTGVYLKGNTVLTMRGATSDQDIAETICKEFKIISPLEY